MGWSLTRGDVGLDPYWSHTELSIESTVSKQLLVLMMSDTVCQIGYRLINICVPSGVRLFTQTN